LNGEIFNDAENFKEYFANLLPLTHKGVKNKVKFAGMFDLDVQNYEYLLKIVYLPDENKATFKIAYFEDNEEKAKFLLKSLEFLFSWVKNYLVLVY